MTGTKLLYELFLQHPLVCTDTRKITKGCLFFALKGPNFNGNAFAAKALEEGASFAIIDEEEYLTDDRCLLVNDVLTKLQELATEHRNRLNIPVIAIVGSNGKTTTKELITSVLSKRFKILATPGNFNNHIGLPLTLLTITNEHQMAVIEMGANHIGENAALCEIARPDYGLITNNGKDHLEGFGTLEGVAQSNSELYYFLLKNNGTAFVNANDEWLMRMASRLEKKVTYAANGEGRNAAANYAITASSLRPEIKFRWSGNNTEVVSCLSGEYNFDNIMAAVAIGFHFGMTEDEIGDGISSYQPSNNRSQVIKRGTNTIYLDAYNANPSSMELSLKNFAAMPFENKIAVLGDMFELGEYEEAEHKNIISLCRGLPFEKVILAGEAFKKQATADDIAFATTAEAIEYIRNNNFQDKNFFLKGSRGMKMESVLEVL